METELGEMLILTGEDTEVKMSVCPVAVSFNHSRVWTYAVNTNPPSLPSLSSPLPSPTLVSTCQLAGGKQKQPDKLVGKMKNIFFWGGGGIKVNNCKTQI